jgi:hypothetical protein
MHRDLNEYKILLESLKGRDHTEDQGIYGRVILKLVSGK